MIQAEEENDEQTHDDVMNVYDEMNKINASYHVLTVNTPKEREKVLKA